MSPFLLVFFHGRDCDGHSLSIEKEITVFVVFRARALINFLSFFGKTGRATPHRPTGLRWCAVALAFGVMGPNSSRGPKYNKYGIQKSQYFRITLHSTGGMILVFA